LHFGGRHGLDRRAATDRSHFYSARWIDLSFSSIFSEDITVTIEIIII